MNLLFCTLIKPANPLAKSLACAALLLVFQHAQIATAVTTAANSSQKPRVIVTSDGEIDDQCSLVRFLLATNEWDVEGLVTSSSHYHAHGHKWPGDDWMEPYLDAYARVYPNLARHDARYPTAEYLRQRALLGNVKAEGEMEEVTAGSQLIAKVLLDETDDRPVWLQAWGGMNTIARALKTIEEEHPERMAEVAKKARFFFIWEQDKTYQEYIRPHWGKYEIPTIISDQFEAIAYRWKQVQPEEMQKYFAAAWMKEHLLENHGPLCALYKAHKNGDFRSEGDSPAFLHTIVTGLRNLESPDWGGWGGRYVRVRENTWLDPVPVSGYAYPEGRWYGNTGWGRNSLREGTTTTAEQRREYFKPMWRWTDAMQNDFAARADWCVKSYEEANHPPVVVLGHAADLEARPGATVQLSTRGTSDPDGDELEYRWWQYRQAGSYDGSIEIRGAEKQDASFTVPGDADNGKTVHMICAVTDTGRPSITRYQRVVIAINNPKKNSATTAAAVDDRSAKHWDDLPEILARIVPPTFPDRDFDITKYGAVADNTTDIKAALDHAIAECNAAGGGRVVVPTGDWLIKGPIHLKSNVNLHLVEGATINFSTDPADYEPLVFTRFEGTELMNYSPLIYAFEQENLAITGKGTFHGRASYDNWWGPGKDTGENIKRARQYGEEGGEGVPVSTRIFGNNTGLRPVFAQPYRCNNILIEGVTFRDSPMWFLNPVLCRNVTIRGISTIGHGPNNDGCDPESTKDVLIEDCYFNTGDDCIAIKAGRDADGRRVGVASENIIIRNCKMLDGHGGVVIGSEMSGGTRNVFAEQCEMDSPNLERALRIKSNSFRGGFVENVHFRNVKVGQVADAVFRINMYYSNNRGEHYPTVRNITMENVTSEKSPRAFYFHGIEELPIQNVTVRNCVFNNVEHASVMSGIENLKLSNVKINEQPKAR
jgi:polygalacturonase